MDLITYALAKKAQSSADLAINILSDFPFGLRYKGAVDYEMDLPYDAQVGDAYTVRYKGVSGTDPDGREFAMGEDGNWIVITPTFQVDQDFNKQSENAQSGTAVWSIINDTLVSFIKENEKKIEFFGTLPIWFDEKYYNSPLVIKGVLGKKPIGSIGLTEDNHLLVLVSQIFDDPISINSTCTFAVLPNFTHEISKDIDFQRWLVPTTYAVKNYINDLIDQTYNATSENAMSGVAVKQAIDQAVGILNAKLESRLDGEI